MKNIIIFSAILSTITACKENNTVTKPTDDNTKNENVVEDAGKTTLDPFNAKISRSKDDMVEDLYDQLIFNDKELTKLDTKIKNINTFTDGVLKEYDEVLTKSDTYYQDAFKKTAEFQDSLLQKTMDSLITTSAEMYMNDNKDLIDKITLAKQQIKEINDRYTAFKIQKTMSEIEKYQKEKSFDLKKMLDLISEQQETLNTLKK